MQQYFSRAPDATVTIDVQDTDQLSMIRIQMRQFNVSTGSELLLSFHLRLFSITTRDYTLQILENAVREVTSDKMSLREANRVYKIHRKTITE